MNDLNFKDNRRFETRVIYVFTIHPSFFIQNEIVSNINYDFVIEQEQKENLNLLHIATLIVNGTNIIVDRSGSLLLYNLSSIHFQTKLEYLEKNKIRCIIKDFYLERST